MGPHLLVNAGSLLSLHWDGDALSPAGYFGISSLSLQEILENLSHFQTKPTRPGVRVSRKNKNENQIEFS